MTTLLREPSALDFARWAECEMETLESLEDQRIEARLAVGRALKLAREQRAMTMRAAAKAVGMDGANLWKIENGMGGWSEPGITRLIALYRTHTAGRP